MNNKNNTWGVVILIMFNCSGVRPINLGLIEGKFLPCPKKPNCVSSQAEIADPHYIVPFKYKKDLVTAFAELKSVIEKQKQVKVITATDIYLNAEFTSMFMGYIDDVEFYFEDSNKTVHVRSASRLGTSDLGVNRRRIESIREQLQF